MEYLYGKLNDLIEQQKYKFTSSDGTINITNSKDNKFDFTVSEAARPLVTLKQVHKDFNTKDDQIKYYSLFRWNPRTNNYDIQLGDEIVVGATANTSTDNQFKAWVYIGEKQVADEHGNLVYNPDGTIKTEPVYEEVGISATGQLVIEQIPTSALIDYHVMQDVNGNIIGTEYINSVIDGNAGGKVY